MFSVLEQLLVTERFRSRAGRQGLMLPALNERELEKGQEPLLATNMRGGFLPTRRTDSGVVRFGFSLVPVGTDDILLVMLLRTLFSYRSEWGNWCSTVDEALNHMRSGGLTPAAIVAPFGVSQDVVPGVKLLQAGLPSGAALVAASPISTGIYVRTGDYVGVLLYRVNQTLVVVGDPNGTVVGRASNSDSSASSQ